jgi:carotenoid cleavage dioxygenase-like enzyme
MSAAAEAALERSPYLEGNYRPTDTEIVARDLPVIGRLPEDLVGIFVRNGSNPKLPPKGRYHWFDGDGMLHCVELESGRAIYRNRYLRTEGLEAEIAAKRPLWTGLLEPTDFRNPRGPYKDTGNTDLVYFHGELLALWWLSGKAHVVRLPDLETLGEESFAGTLPRCISAHPKIDPHTGEMIFFDYQPVPPYLIYGVISPEGRVVHHTSIDLPGPRFQHDIAITERFSIVFDFSLQWDEALLARGKSKLVFRRDRPTRFGVIPRFGRSEDVRWFEASPCFMYHTINAWEDAGEIVLLGCKTENPLAADPANPPARGAAPLLGHLRLEPLFHRWRFDLESGSTKEEVIDDVSSEFPRMDQRRLGVRSRYSYHGRFERAEVMRFNAVVKYDAESGASRAHVYPKGWYGGEAVFAPRLGSMAEDDGYLLTFVANEASGESELYVIDARDPERSPVARVQIPQRVPTGYHTWWVSASDLESQRGRA